MIKHDFDIVFLGGLFPKQTEEEIISNSIGKIDNAANNLQWNLVNGFDANLKRPVKIINSLYVGSYPKKFKTAKISTYEFKHSESSSDINVGFVNIAGIKHFYRFKSLKPFLKKWATSKTQSNKVIIAYALTSVFVELLFYIKKINAKVVTVIIVPDLPQYMDTTNNKSIIRNIFKAISISHINYRILNIDGFVLLTKYMIDALNLYEKNTVVVEGISSFFPTNISNDATGIIKIVYTGTLNLRYGVLNLVNAFMRIDKINFRLVLCGTGDAVSLIEDAIRVDNRIIYMGQLNKIDILDIQNSATILVNPRQNNEIFTKYSFPSKILEYLSCGKPVIAYKLDGIPDEYDNFIYYVNDDSIESLKNKIIEIAEQPDKVRQAFGEAARNWVLKDKNCVKQTAKILEMIIELVKKRTG